MTPQALAAQIQIIGKLLFAISRICALSASNYVIGPLGNQTLQMNQTQVSQSLIDYDSLRGQLLMAVQALPDSTSLLQAPGPINPPKSPFDPQPGGNQPGPGEPTP